MVTTIGGECSTTIATSQHDNNQSNHNNHNNNNDSGCCYCCCEFGYCSSRRDRWGLADDTTTSVAITATTVVLFRLVANRSMDGVSKITQ
mmetsp:Transcript_42613/g.46256  ORF Transcript_42613/g.46256 Transcript_42613/m.46256 type:complete len:90 (+) Transcript_42613:352-621(+)